MVHVTWVVVVGQMPRRSLLAYTCRDCCSDICVLQAQAEGEAVSRWQIKKEQKRQMYMQSTDAVVPLASARAKAASDELKKCQKCLKTGHWTYECKAPRVYTVRNSKSAQVWLPRRVWCCCRG